MIAIKTDLTVIPEHCDYCRWYGTRPHPIKGWMDLCELMGECMDEDAKEGWYYDCESRPANCPLVEIEDGDKE